MSYRVNFIMDQIAGHVTNYHNLKRASRDDSDMIAVWHEIYYYKANGVFERIRETALPFVSSYISGILRGAWETRLALRDENDYDAVFTNASVGVFFSGHFRRTPTMIDFDSTPLQIDRMQGYGEKPDLKPIAHLKWRLFRNMLHSATLLQAWSHWARQSAIDEYGVPPEKIFVNPPGVDLDFWQPSPSRANAKRPLRILFVGSDFRRKGGELLLQWYRTQRPEKCQLHIVTREPVEQTNGVFVYRSIQPNSEELLQLYKQSDLFVLPSLGECFGIATIEAMAAGLPVIVSDVGGTRDIVDHGRNGYIVPNIDAAELGRAIERILGDEIGREQMAVQSRLIAEERFDVRRNAQKTFEHLRIMARSTQKADSVRAAR